MAGQINNVIGKSTRITRAISHGCGPPNGWLHGWAAPEAFRVPTSRPIQMMPFLLVLFSGVTPIQLLYAKGVSLCDSSHADPSLKVHPRHLWM
jgi:hypothetical protein